VDRGDEALRLAARGEADVALLPESTVLGDFTQRNDGVIVATIQVGGEPLRVVEINAAAHPTVDASGAHLLAQSLAGPLGQWELTRRAVARGAHARVLYGIGCFSKNCAIHSLVSMSIESVPTPSGAPPGHW